MPKISYLAKAKNGTDDTEVTALQIEQKIADIEALLRGMIDEDNMLCADDGTKIVPLSPSNIADMPIETRPVQQCMKFFSKTGEHTSTAVTTLFDETIELQESNPNFITIGGMGDKEIFITLVSDDVTKVDNKTVYAEIEMAPYHVPVTCRELWDYVKNINPFISFAFTDAIDDWFQTNVECATLEQFASIIGFDPDDIIFEFSYIVPAGINEWVMTKPWTNLKNNTISFTATAESTKEGGYACKYNCAVLCRINQ